MIRDPRDRKSWQKAQFSLKYRMIEIDREIREQKKNSEKKAPQPGIRKIILEAYEKNGINGAMLALKMYNKRAKTNFTWKDAEAWINEERQKDGIEHDDY